MSGSSAGMRTIGDSSARGVYQRWGIDDAVAHPGTVVSVQLGLQVRLIIGVLLAVLHVGLDGGTTNNWIAYGTLDVVELVGVSGSIIAIFEVGTLDAVGQFGINASAHDVTAGVVTATNGVVLAVVQLGATVSVKSISWVGVPLAVIQCGITVSVLAMFIVAAPTLVLQYGIIVSVHIGLFA